MRTQLMPPPHGSALATCLLPRAVTDQCNDIIPSMHCAFLPGVDIATVSLKRLRSRLAIIPQDPVLWSCSVRDNLDPFHKASDARVWGALEQVGLKGLLWANEKAYPGGLSFGVSEASGGGPLSAPPPFSPPLRIRESHTVVGVVSFLPNRSHAWPLR